ncbi:hypothetical protein [Cloacibacillus evryensis]|uniref:Uncharacterized protein n=1 Tax=Cloacibacillus evryensis TaxID=508460 RepID=A0AAW5KCU1_9BACT|nr:hypothetical protein [Cloacibacillus evryensis]MCQ4815623.1 hypothetical protein [Cloacibacillus evryensis]
MNRKKSAEAIVLVKEKKHQEGPNGNKLLRRKKVGQCEESRKLRKQAVHARTSWKRKAP